MDCKINYIVIDPVPGMMVTTVLREAHIMAAQQKCDVVVIHNGRWWRAGEKTSLRGLLGSEGMEWVDPFTGENRWNGKQVFEPCEAKSRKQ